MFSMIAKRGTFMAWLLCLAAAVLVVGCSSRSTSDDAGSDTTDITITASPAAFDVNSTSVVEAVVMNDGSPVEGQLVEFSVQPTDAGYFTPASATTDAEGTAATVFTATSTGSVILTAEGETADGSISSTVGISVNQQQQTGSGNVTISVAQSLLLANGSDTTAVTITVRDGDGQLVPDNTPLVVVAGEKFVDIDENGIWTHGIDSLVFDANGNGTWDAIGQIPTNIVTAGGAGEATANYVSGNNVGTVYLKVTVGDQTIGGTAETSLQLQPNATINSIYLYSDSINLAVKGTGGIETGILRATGYDIWGNPVPEGMTVTFLITDGPGGGEQLDSVGYGPYTATTNSQGTAVVSVHSGQISGTIRVRAQHGTVLSNATQVMVSAGPPAYIVVGTEFLNIDYWNTVGEEVGITAVCSDIYLNPVVDNTVVYFTVDEGTMKSHEARTQNLDGIAQTKWISGNNVPTADGRVVVIAETSGGTVVDSGGFFNSYVLDTMISSDAVPASMLADGKDVVVIEFTGWDLNMNPVIDGTAYDADARILGVEGGAFAYGGGTVSVSRTKITSARLEEDRSLTGGNDDGIGAVDTVWYWGGTANSAYPIALTTGPAYSANCEVKGPNSLTLGETAHLSVFIRDRFENPLGDHTIILTASSGIVGGATQNTNGYGEAAGFNWTPADTGSVNLIFQDTDPRGTNAVLTHRISVAP